MKLNSALGVQLVIVLMLILVAPGRAAYPVSPDPEAVAQVLAGERFEANAAWWGFDPEDSTEFLQAAINSGADRLIIPNMGADWVVGPLFLRSNQEIIFEEGVVITAKPGEFRSKYDSLITLRDVENVVLRGYGATVRMQKEDYRQPPYERGEWRMGISLRGARNVHVLGLTVRDTGGDGIYVDGSAERIASENIVIRDVVADNNYRQGISVISVKNLLVENSVFRNTEGTPPMAGIDLEPDDPEQILIDVVLRNNVFEGNRGDGILISIHNLNEESEPVSVVVENNVIRGNRNGIHFSTYLAQVRGKVLFRQNIVEGSLQSGLYVHEVSEPPLQLVFADLMLKDVATAPISMPITLDAGRGGMGEVVFRNVVVADALHRPTLRATSGDYTAVSGQIQVLNWHGAQAEWADGAQGADLTLVQRPSALIFYSDPPGEVMAQPVVHFADMDRRGAAVPVTGLYSPNVSLLGFDEGDLRNVSFYFDGDLIYSGDRPPTAGEIIIDTVARNPERRISVAHELRVVAESERFGRVEGSLDISARNFWRERDDLEGPVQTWFGPVYHSRTHAESDGWDFALGDDAAFHGDPHRRARVDNTTEYLVWSTPQIEEIQFTLYVKEALPADVVEVAVSADGEAWQRVAYTVDSEGESEAGWRKVILRSPVGKSQSAQYTRLTLRATPQPVEVQVGQAIFVGRLE